VDHFRCPLLPLTSRQISGVIFTLQQVGIYIYIVDLLYHNRLLQSLKSSRNSSPIQFACTFLCSLSENKMRNEGYFVFPEPAYVSSPERRFVEDPYYAQFPPPRSGSITPVIIDEEARFRMEHMERQLANLTGLVQKALVVQPPVPQMPPPTRLVQSSPLPRNILPPGATTVSVTPSTPTSYRDYIPTRDYRGTQTLSLHP